MGKLEKRSRQMEEPRGFSSTMAGLSTSDWPIPPIPPSRHDLVGKCIIHCKQLLHSARF